MYMVRQQTAARNTRCHGAAVECLDHFISCPRRNPVTIDFAYESVPACVSHNYDFGLSGRDYTSGASIQRPDAAPRETHYAAFGFHVDRHPVTC